MKAIEAVKESVWGIAHHPTGTSIIKGMGFTVSLPGDDSFYVAEEENLPKCLQELGIDDNKWVPDESEDEE